MSPASTIQALGETLSLILSLPTKFICTSPPAKQLKYLD